jgi:hypothetical protein
LPSARRRRASFCCCCVSFGEIPSIMVVSILRPASRLVCGAARGGLIVLTNRNQKDGLAELAEPTRTRGSCSGSWPPCNAVCHEQDAAGEGCAGGCAGSGATGQRAAVAPAARHCQAALSQVPLLVRRVRPAHATPPGLCRLGQPARVSVGVVTAAPWASASLPAAAAASSRRWPGRTPAPERCR